MQQEQHCANNGGDSHFLRRDASRALCGRGDTLVVDICLALSSDVQLNGCDMYVFDAISTQIVMVQ